MEKDKKKVTFTKKQPKNNENMAVSKRQQQFDENREVTEKKPFDKKTYRLKKYSKKYRLDQWEENRKKKLLRDYYKENKNDSKTEVAGSYKVNSFDEDTTDSTVGRFVRHPDLMEKINVQPRKDPLSRAREHLNRMKEEKNQKKQEILKAKEEREQKLLEYKKKKQQKFKMLSKKNKKGQPMMAGRLEMMLEKIQKNVQ